MNDQPSLSGSQRYLPAISDDLPPGPRSMIAVVRALSGHEEQLADAISTLASAVRREAGCKDFRAFRNAADPGEFYLYEIYDDTDAFRVHLTLDHVARFFTELDAHSSSDAQALVQLLELPVA